MSILNVSETTHPVADYGDAAHRVDLMQNRDTEEILPVAGTQLLTYGFKTDRAIVLLHGLSGSPEQCFELGKRFFDSGYNVLIPRMPHHGYADRMTGKQAKLTAEDLLAYTNEAVDITQGLGKHVTVAGISIGGTCAALAGVFRRDVNLAVLINPAFALPGMSAGMTQAVAKLLLRLPNVYFYANPLQGAKFGPAYIYPRVSSHAFARAMAPAETVYQASLSNKPAASSILAIVNRKDYSLNHKVTSRILENWKKNGAEHVHKREFTHLPILHEIVDPWYLGAHLARAHSLMQDWIIEAA